MNDFFHGWVGWRLVGGEFSVTRFGDILNFVVTNFLTNVAQIFWYIFGLF